MCINSYLKISLLLLFFLLTGCLQQKAVLVQEYTDEELYETIYNRLEQADDVPAAAYSFKLYDNTINPARARGGDHHSFDKTQIPLIKR